MNKFELIKEDLLKETDEGWVFQEVANHLGNLLGDARYVIDAIESLQGTPECAKHISYAWFFSGEVGGCGLSEYLMNYALDISDTELLSTLIAIKKLNHTELHHKFESGILLAFQKIEGFSDAHNRDNYQELVIHEEYNTLDKVDENSLDMSETDLEEYAGAYIRKHRTELFDTSVL